MRTHSFKDLAVGERFRFANSPTFSHWCEKLSMRKYRCVFEDTGVVYQVGTVKVGVEKQSDVDAEWAFQQERREGTQ